MLLEYGVSLDVNLLALSALSLAFTPRSLRLHILILQKVQVQELNGRYSTQSQVQSLLQTNEALWSAPRITMA